MLSYIKNLIIQWKILSLKTDLSYVGTAWAICGKTESATQAATRLKKEYKDKIKLLEENFK